MTGCGGESSSSSEPQRLSSADEAVVTTAQTALQNYCRKVGLYLTRRQPLPGAAETEQVNEAVDRLLFLADEKPAAPFRNRGTLRDVIGDMAEDLEGANCSNALEAKLNRGFAALPPG